MCGIAGIWGNPRPERLALMAQRLAHRGPDDSGTWSSADGRLTLVHRRLAVIDLEGGRQPMVDETGDHVLVFNGAIYNHRDLRRRLEATRSFRTVSDTEVILQGYLEHGPAVVDQLQGMFAFALWDGHHQELFLCRDPLGQKPLFFHEGARDFSFASELTALTGAVQESLSVDPEAIAEFLGWGAILPPKTIYRDVKSVQPGEWMVIREQRVVHRERYWRPGPRQVSTRESSGHQAVDSTFENLVRTAVVRHLEADVPVACFLSGGIDSGLVAAMAAQAGSGRLETITAGFEDPAWDERTSARLVATHLGTKHHEVMVRPKIVEDLPGILARHGQPFGDPSAVPAHYLAHAARGLAKVVLLGDGGDEVFAGYRRHLASRWVGWLGLFDRPVSHRFIRSVLDRLPSPTAFRSPYAWAHRWLRGFASADAPRYLTWTVDGFTGRELHALAIGADKDPAFCFAAEQRAEELLSPFRGHDPVDVMQWAELSSFLPAKFLVKTDIATMSFGLEARCPFLDRPLVEAALQLPASKRLPGFVTKPILRTMARQYLPAAIVDAPKRGFEIPLSRWLQGELADLCGDVILSRGGVLADVASRQDRERLLLEPFRPDLHGWSRRVWLLLCLGLWEQTRTNQ